MTAPTNSAPRLITCLRGLVKDPERPDRAALATLKRGAGRPPATVAEMYPLVEPLLHENASPHERDAAYLTAALFALHPLDWPKDEGDRRRAAQRSFGATLRAARWREEQHTRENEDRGLERRFVALLEARREDLAPHLRGLVTLLQARNEHARVDYEQLFRDLTWWDHPERDVQRRWAEGFWRGSALDATPGDDPADAANNNDDDN